MKRCPRCGEAKSFDAFGTRKRGGLQGYCRICSVQNAQAWSKANPERRAAIEAKATTQRRARRIETIQAYGGQCNCPNCLQDNPEFLQFDHINGDGAKHRRSGMRAIVGFLWREHERTGEWPPGFQLLCANCNQSKGTSEACRLAGLPHHPGQRPILLKKAG